MLLNAPNSLRICLSISTMFLLVSTNNDHDERGVISLQPSRTEPVQDDALFLTPYIEKGQILEAQKLAKVPPMLRNVQSFSGYLTVNKTASSNIFFWMFKSQQGDWKKRPLVVWLQGGPGASSLFGLFTELGPFYVTEKQTLKRRKYSWNRKCNLVFIDNPVGAGFSFTKEDSAYARDETDVARDLYEALVQLYKLFPSLQKNKLFITGESYAGKYIPAIAHKIYNMNKVSNFKIRINGLMIGDGFTDPINMMDMSSYIFKLGLIDEATQKRLSVAEDEVRANTRAGEYGAAGKMRLAEKGLRSLYNYVDDEEINFDPTLKFLNNSRTRKAIHVGNYEFNDKLLAYNYLQNDIMQSVKNLVEELLTAEEFPILFYNGQLDITDAYILSVEFFNSLKWPYAVEYYRAKRCQFRVETEVAGYYKTAGSFTEVLVRNAGHMVPTSQPKWAFELLDRFVTNSSSFVC